MIVTTDLRQVHNMRKGWLSTHFSRNKLQQLPWVECLSWWQHVLPHTSPAVGAVVGSCAFLLLAFAAWVPEIRRTTELVRPQESFPLYLWLLPLRAAADFFRNAYVYCILCNQTFTYAKKMFAYVWINACVLQMKENKTIQTYHCIFIVIVLS